MDRGEKGCVGCSLLADHLDGPLQHLQHRDLLELTPRGRDERIRGNLTDWVRHHDRYGAGGTVETAGRFVAEAQADAGSSCCDKHAQAEGLHEIYFVSPVEFGAGRST